MRKVCFCFSVVHNCDRCAVFYTAIAGKNMYALSQINVDSWCQSTSMLEHFFFFTKYIQVFWWLSFLFCCMKLKWTVNDEIDRETALWEWCRSCGCFHRVIICQQRWGHRRLETEKWPPLRNPTWLVKQLVTGWLINIPPFFGFQLGRRSWPRPWLIGNWQVMYLENI